MNSRSRNLWSAEEDNTLRGLVEACEKDKVDWRVIASYLPGRNNKDCRKRWHYRVSASMNLGPWSQSEDELLKMGIHRFGTHWSRVAQVVGTRNGDQCFKRWNDVLDPGIDRSPWTREEDRRLLHAIGEYGRAWKQIVDAYFPGRTGLDAKNRHRQLTRKRKRECKSSTSPTAKMEQKEIKQPPAKLIPVSLPSPSPSSSLPSSTTTSPSSMRMSLGHQHTIDAPLNYSQLIHPDQQQQQQQQLEFNERPLSAPPCAYSCWELPLEEMLSPTLPTTPYSSCSSTCTPGSNYDGSLSHLDDLQPRHQHQRQQLHSLATTTPTELDHQYESTLLMNGIQAAPYPYFTGPPPPLPHNHPIDIQQQQALDFLLSEQQQNGVLNLPRSISSNGGMRHSLGGVLTMDGAVTF